MWTNDVYVRFVPLPMKVEGVTTSNPDGSCNIYINCMLSRRTQIEALRHEVNHVKKNHLFDDVKTLAQKEKEADEDLISFSECDLKFCS